MQRRQPFPSSCDPESPSACERCASQQQTNASVARRRRCWMRRRCRMPPFVQGASRASRVGDRRSTFPTAQGGLCRRHSPGRCPHAATLSPFTAAHQHRRQFTSDADSTADQLIPTGSLSEPLSCYRCCFLQEFPAPPLHAKPPVR